MSRIRIVDPSRGTADNAESRLDAEEDASSFSIGPSYHLTHLSCFSLTESKHMGQRTHLGFSEVDA
jgi:hypothetical protein